LEFSIKTVGLEKQAAACIVVGIYESGKLSPSAKSLDAQSGSRLAKLIRGGDIDGTSGSSLLIHNPPGVAAERVLLIGLGKEKTFSDKDYLAAIATAVRKLDSIGGANALLCFTELDLHDRDVVWKVRHAVIAAQDALYEFEQLKSRKKDAKRALRSLSFSVASEPDASAARQGLAQGLAIAAGISLARDLGNLPANICTPGYLAETARTIAREHKLAAEILDRSAMKKLGMNTLLSVAQGSHEPPKFIVIRHAGGLKSDKPVVLVGKGITFDTGGISLKPGAEMDEMKFDMCGAASVLGALKAVAAMKLPINVIGIIPATENMPGGGATKPGDIIKSMSGQTVEILNTDAEGRLILCDALTYAERFNPDCVVDIATLTGACVIALGNVATGLFTNDETLAGELLAAGDNACDRAWRLPLWDDYQDQLKSNFADMANIGGRAGGSITAACFLSRFTGKYRWAHLDIAGTAWRSGKEKGSTGRPVSMLTHFLMDRAAQVQKNASGKRRK
jgi:leucyl aminopeptidase